jgi:hypothetical protein
MLARKLRRIFGSILIIIAAVGCTAWLVIIIYLSLTVVATFSLARAIMGNPDPRWVGANLRFLMKEKMVLLLVCGRIAKATYLETGLTVSRVLFIDHPAARRWSNEKLNAVALEIESLCRELP